MRWLYNNVCWVESAKKMIGVFKIWRGSGSLSSSIQHNIFPSQNNWFGSRSIFRSIETDGRKHIFETCRQGLTLLCTAIYGLTMMMTVQILKLTQPCPRKKTQRQLKLVKVYYPRFSHKIAWIIINISVIILCLHVERDHISSKAKMTREI